MDLNSANRPLETMVHLSKLRHPCLPQNVGSFSITGISQCRHASTGSLGSCARPLKPWCREDEAADICPATGRRNVEYCAISYLPPIRGYSALWHSRRAFRTSGVDVRNAAGQHFQAGYPITTGRGLQKGADRDGKLLLRVG